MTQHYFTNIEDLYNDNKEDYHGNDATTTQLSTLFANTNERKSLPPCEIKCTDILNHITMCPVCSKLYKEVEKNHQQPAHHHQEPVHHHQEPVHHHQQPAHHQEPVHHHQQPAHHQQQFLHNQQLLHNQPQPTQHHQKPAHQQQQFLHNQQLLQHSKVKRENFVTAAAVDNCSKLKKTVVVLGAVLVIIFLLWLISVVKKNKGVKISPVVSQFSPYMNRR